ncbi:alpha-1,3-arabinosyltransferase XAT2-like isoform X1 [Vigna unguiculata]|uniref:alpha-1,3-arabinosyltransferase XAT2-like isoform X1 n=2 Tax=Vigna unguiculata TaxID=3917 RepID=UPI001016333C|nr:alpha-1,3-arabinosyltransferase XAT2-like isoform X1 [Vigna unguiculata]
MIYDTVLAKSFSRYEQKKLGYGAFLSCLFIVFSLCTVFKPYLGPVHALNLKLFIGVDTKMLITRSSSQIAQQVEGKETKKEELLCTSEERTEFCQAKGDIRIQGKSSTVYIASSEATTLEKNMSRSLKPYARRDDVDAMILVREWTLKAENVVNQKVPECTQNHSIPAVLFSTGGYTGNHFHEFTDIVIPLFLTARKFNGEVQFIIADKRPWWISKHKPFLKKLSHYEIMDMDEDEGVHCFPSVNVGLKRYHKELSIDPQKYSYSMKDFRAFLRSSYALKRFQAIKIRNGQHRKPRLMILSRKRSRSFINTDEIEKMAKSFGFDVIVKEAGKSMWGFAHVVNSCDVLLGVHGAGLTNILFLPENAVFIQVVPYGGYALDWLATNDFGKPSKDMNIKYLEYKISLEESTLVEQYPLDHMFLKDPPLIGKIGWQEFKSVYLDKQNVKLDVHRFKPTLQRALELLHK